MKKENIQENPERRSGIRLKFVIMLFLFSWLVLIFMPVMTTGIVPFELLGKWITNDTRYQDRFFELTETYIAFGIGENKLNVYFISSVRWEIDDYGTQYTIMAKNLEGLPHKFHFYYQKHKVGIIRLKNQTGMAWTKIK